jgi:putative transposase
MPSTHTCLHVHLVFGTHARYPFLEPGFREHVHAYLGGILRNMEVVPLAIDGVDDHVHLLAGFKPRHSIAEVLRVLKSDSCRWIHTQPRRSKFAWQEGYGAFAVCRSEIEAVSRYIRGQREHHRRQTFQEEYRALLQREGVAFDERFLW